jgi:hypothetical protein
MNYLNNTTVTYHFNSKICKASILTIGLILGLLIIARGQDIQHIKKFSGKYVAGEQHIEKSIDLTFNEKFSFQDNNGKKIEVSVHRLIEKINIIDVSTYFYEVSLKKEGQDYLVTKDTMELIHNSTSNLVLIDIADLRTLKRVSSSI